MSELRVISSREILQIEGLEDPLFRALFNFWQSLDPGRDIPRHACFDIVDLNPEIWPNLIYADVFGSPPDFVYRVSGTEVDLANGFNLQGLALSSFRDMGPDPLLAEFRQMVDSGVPRFSEGVFLSGDQNFESVSRLVCPLAEEGGRISRILGAVRFVWRRGQDKRNRSGRKPQRIFV